MKIIAEYDPKTGMVKDLDGNNWYVNIDLQFETTNDTNDTNNSNSNSNNVGFTAKDLCMLKDKGII